MAYDQEKVDRLIMLQAEIDARYANKCYDKTCTMADMRDWETDCMCIAHDLALAKGEIDF